MGRRTARTIASSASLDFDRVDFHVFVRPVLSVAGRIGNFFDYIVAFDDLAEDAVLSIEPRGRGHGDEELASVGVRAGIGHGEHALALVLEGGVELVGEAIARIAAAGPLRASALNHE